VDNAISILRVAIVAHHPEERLVDIEAVVNLGRTRSTIEEPFVLDHCKFVIEMFRDVRDGLPSNRSTVNLQRKGGSPEKANHYEGAKRCG
jgi:hypothetical protein